MVSYAQNAEDVLLNRAFGGQSRGFYIDVGANDPILHSVTRHFYGLGWTGINIEPEQGTPLFGRLCADRPRDVNLNLGVSDREGVLTFLQASASGGWSTFSAEQAAHLAGRGIEVLERRVPVTTLARICLEHVPHGLAIDFLKVDAESHEPEVLRGADWQRWRPRVVLVEDNGTHLWEPILLGASYCFAIFDGLNRYYVRAEEPGLLPRLAAPVNALDDYIPVRYQRTLELEGLGPAAVRIARRFQRTSDRHPGLGRLLSRMIA